MELNEIVNPYFSFPVVGVVICAVLVYAFGFKAPVQPPSFDFDGDKKFSKKRKVSKKSLSNGNATSVLTTTSPNLKAAVDLKSSKTSSPKARQNSTAAVNASNGINSQLVVSKAEKEQKVPAKGTVDKKNKKEKVAPKPIVQEEVAKPIPKVIEGRKEDGEWVQTLSRKEKKNRKREETVDDFIKDGLITNYKDSITPTNSKENSPSKKKKTANKNDINKSKVMKEKLDDNIEFPSLLESIGEMVSPVKNENKPEAKAKKGELKENKSEKKENKVEKKENKPEKKPEIKETIIGKENKSEKTPIIWRRKLNRRKRKINPKKKRISRRKRKINPRRRKINLKRRKINPKRRKINPRRKRLSLRKHKLNQKSLREILKMKALQSRVRLNLKTRLIPMWKRNLFPKKQKTLMCLSLFQPLLLKKPI